MNVIFIQARVNSDRLKFKIFKKINGISIIDWVNLRLRNTKNIDKIIFLIPSNSKNNILKKYLIKNNIDFMVGPEKNVLKRFYIAAKEIGAKKIIRVCCDNPFVCPDEIYKLVKFFNRKKLNYAFNHRPIGNNYPDGLGAEIVDFKTLEFVYLNASKKNHKEHIFNYIIENHQKFKISTFNASKEIGQNYLLKLDVDTLNDLKKFSNLNINPHMQTKDLLKIIKRNKNEKL